LLLLTNLRDRQQNSFPHFGKDAILGRVISKNGFFSGCARIALSTAYGPAFTAAPTAARA